MQSREHSGGILGRPRRVDDADLAAIVLATPADRRIRWSVAAFLLVLVAAVGVGIAAGVVGDRMSSSRAEMQAPSAEARGARAGDATDRRAATDDRSAAVAQPVTSDRRIAAERGGGVTDGAAASGAAARPDLVARRISIVEGDDGASLVQVELANIGPARFEASEGARAVVLVDGEPAGEAQLPSLDAADGSSSLRVPLDACRDGRHVVTVILDAGAAVADMRVVDNTSSARVLLACA